MQTLVSKDDEVEVDPLWIFQPVELMEQRTDRESKEESMVSTLY